MRAGPKPRPENLTAPPDGQKLEDIIRDLQSAYGVPQYPQEYRLTFRVADKETRSQRSSGGKSTGKAAAMVEEIEESATPPPGGDGSPRREKAPAAPRIKADGAPDGAEGTKRRRRRKRRRGR